MTLTHKQINLLDTQCLLSFRTDKDVP